MPTSGSKTPPVTSSLVFVQPQQQQQKSGAVPQLFPEAVVAPVAKKAVTQPSGTNSGSAVVKPVVSYSTAGSTTLISITSGAASIRTTLFVAGKNPAPTKPSPQQMVPQVGKSSDKTSQNKFRLNNNLPLHLAVSSPNLLAASFQNRHSFRYRWRFPQDAGISRIWGC